MARMLEISTSAGADVFVVQRFSGREELGRLYEYRLELLSEHNDLTAEQLLGTNATVALWMPDNSERFFNGYITRFSIQGAVTTTAFKSNTGYLYLVTLSPGLWFLTRTSDSQIFPQMAVNDIIMQVLNKDTLMKTASTVGQTEQRDYVVQYRETSFNFVSRLAEHAGIYYYFTHENGSHTMNLLDKVGDHKPIPNLAQLTFSGANASDGTLSSLVMVSEIQPGAFATGDYNYVMPNTQIAAVSTVAKSHPNAGLEMFDHPIDSTTSSWAQTYAAIRGDELSWGYEVAHGTSSDRNIAVGFKTTVAKHSIDAMNREYIIIGHSFEATNNLGASGAGDGASWTCSFEAIPSSVQFRPMRTVAKPVIAGTQVALVVADFHNDTDSSGASDPIGANMGRVKVEFFWDRYGKQSCWARVSQPWAGRGYGFQNMPRIGEEVLVQFLEGDPDRPVVIGRVYNAQNMPPWPLPDGASITGLKTLSIDPSGKSVAGSWNELRLDDKSGSEQVYVQAQKDYDRRVLNDAKIWIGNESHEIVAADTFKQYKQDLHVQTTGDQNQKIGGSLSFDVEQDVHVKSAQGKILVESSPTQEIHLKGGMKVIVEASTQLTLKVGGNFIDINPGGIFIKGTMVMMNSGGSAGSGTAAQPIKPKDPKEAMTSSAGSAADKPTPPTPPKPATYSPQATSFVLAAQTGAPLVAQCPGL